MVILVANLTALEGKVMKWSRNSKSWRPKS